MLDLGIADADTFANEVQVDFEMLSALVLNRVAGEVHCVDIVTEHNGGSTELSETLMEPAGLGDDICHNVVFRFYARTRHNVLALTGAGH